MKIKDIIKDLPNVRWIAVTVKPFLPALILIVVIETLSSLAGVANAIVSKNIIDFAVNGELNTAIAYIALFVFIILASMAARAFLSVFSVRTLELYSNTLRQRVFAKLINIEWIQVSRYHSGDLLTRLTSDISAVANGSISILAQMVALGAQLTAAFITLMIYEPSLAILAFFLAPFTVVLSRVFAGKLKRMHVKIQETESSYRSLIQEFLQNLLVLKTFNLEEESKSRIDELQKERLHWVQERSKTGVVANTILSLSYWTGYILAFSWGVTKLANKTATFGTMTAFLQLVNQIQMPFIGLSRTLPQIISALASAGRIIELENLDMEAEENELETSISAGIRFKDVSFSYEKNETVLDSISMEALPGEIVALCGTSGEGKTTMIRLMLALMKPEHGSVQCFSENGNEYPASPATRKWFSYVPQGNTLFSGTISENLRLGETGASEEVLKAALEAAGALDFVEKLPDGMETVIGEKAHGLSEGQAQRISIARAILRKAPIIILDEATSALDIELEEKVLHNIRSLTPKRTCIMITHRKTSLGMCNRIYKLKEGKLTLG